MCMYAYKKKFGELQRERERVREREREMVGNQMNI